MSLRGNNPASTLTPLSKKTYEEVLTAHNISSLLLLRAYIPEKGESYFKIFMTLQLFLRLSFIFFFFLGFESYNIQQRVGFCRLIQFLLHVCILLYLTSSQLRKLLV